MMINTVTEVDRQSHSIPWEYFTGGIKVGKVKAFGELP
jgi:hypothetical protein